MAQPIPIRAIDQFAPTQQDACSIALSQAQVAQAVVRCSPPIPCDYDIVETPQLQTLDYCIVGNTRTGKSIPKGGSKNGKSSCAIS